jgi:hypothetical protein
MDAGHEGVGGNETAGQLAKLEYNASSCDLNQLAAFQQGLPRRLPGTGQTVTIKNIGNH